MFSHIDFSCFKQTKKMVYILHIYKTTQFVNVLRKIHLIKSQMLRDSITQCGLACPVRVQWFRVSSHPVWAHVFHTIDRSARPGHTRAAPDHRWLKPWPAGAQAATGLFWVMISLNVASKHLFRRHRASQTTVLCAGGPDRSRRLIKGRSAF